MGKFIRIGVDLAKNYFQVHADDSRPMTRVGGIKRNANSPMRRHISPAKRLSRRWRRRRAQPWRARKGDGAKARLLQRRLELSANGRRRSRQEIQRPLEGMLMLGRLFGEKSGFEAAIDALGKTLR